MFILLIETMLHHAVVPMQCISQRSLLTHLLLEKGGIFLQVQVNIEIRASVSAKLLSQSLLLADAYPSMDVDHIKATLNCSALPRHKPSRAAFSATPTGRQTPEWHVL